VEKFAGWLSRRRKLYFGRTPIPLKKARYVLQGECCHRSFCVRSNET
jgi:hypothetical protein